MEIVARWQVYWRENIQYLWRGCGNQPPSWPSVISTSKCLYPCVDQPAFYQGQSLWPIQYGRSDMLPRLGYEKTTSLLSEFPLSQLSGSGESRLPCYRENEAGLRKGEADDEKGRRRVPGLGEHSSEDQRIPGLESLELLCPWSGHMPYCRLVGL